MPIPLEEAKRLIASDSSTAEELAAASAVIIESKEAGSEIRIDCLLRLAKVPEMGKLLVQLARRMVADDAAEFLEWVYATDAIIAQPDLSALEDLLLCLRRRGIPAEYATLELYRRTNRPHVRGSAFVLDPEDWAEYVKNLRKGNSAMG